LAGKWLEPVPGRRNAWQGFELYVDGSAKSINMETLQYLGWEADATHLTLILKSIGNHTESTGKVIYQYEQPTPDTLLLSNRNNTFTYTRK